jgi:hypothetical protein
MCPISSVTTSRPDLVAGCCANSLMRRRVTPGASSASPIQATTHLRSLPISPWARLAVLAAWATAALLVGGVVL